MLNTNIHNIDFRGFGSFKSQWTNSHFGWGSIQEWGCIQADTVHKFNYFSGMTRHQRDDDLSYGRRTFEAHSLRPAFVPYHLYGQLASSKQGMEFLIK